jgi:hypothetical protein
MVIKPEDYEYYELFHEIVQTGIISGLAHPIEWWISLYRYLYESGPTDRYLSLFKLAHRYFNDMYESFFMEKPIRANVLKWLKSHYHKIHMFKEDFENILERAYLYEKGKENE